MWPRLQRLWICTGAQNPHSFISKKQVCSGWHFCISACRFSEVYLHFLLHPFCYLEMWIILEFWYVHCNDGICLLLGFSQVYLHFPSSSLLPSIWICEFVPDDSGLHTLWFWHPSAAMLCRTENGLTVLFVGIQVLITSYWLAIWRCYPLSWFKCFLGPSWTYILLCYLHSVARGFMGWKCMKLWFDLVPGEFWGWK